MDLKKTICGLCKRRTPLEYILYAAFIALGVGLDQLTKYLAVMCLMPLGSVPLIEGVLHLTYVENPGAAFGMLADMPWLFNSFSSLAIIFILFYLYLGHADRPLVAASLIMICAGGIGNMIDRLALSYVVDFIDFCLINFAVFNVADCFVCIGAGLLVLSLLLDIIKESRQAKEGDKCS